jgi:hypothetical protein
MINLLGCQRLPLIILITDDPLNKAVYTAQHNLS